MVLRYRGRSMGQSGHAPTSSLATDFSPSSVVVVSVLPLGRFLASMFSILSCFPFFPVFTTFTLILHTTLLSETHLAYPIVFFPLVFFLSSDPLSPPLTGFHL